MMRERDEEACCPSLHHVLYIGIGKPEQRKILLALEIRVDDTG